ncbi:MAG: hypothetical protein JXQ27_02395 [Acidobacteria bacterium]|nr:hypothetical protein [Acidobacteriota bacterium]
MSVAVWVLGLWLGVAVGGSGPAKEPLPEVAAPPGWEHTAPDRLYTASDLYGYINGGAEVFLELGFRQLKVRKFARGEDVLAVEIYRMRDTAAALGTYLMKCGRERRDPSLAGRHTVGRYQLMMQQNRYFVLIHNESGVEAVITDMIACGRAVLRRLPPDEDVPALKNMPQPNRVDGSLRLIRGPFTLQAVYTLGSGDILQLGGQVTAVAADYAVAADETHTLIRTEYPSVARARAAFRQVRSGLDPELTVRRDGADRFFFQDYAGRYGLVVRDGARLDVTVNLAVPPQ